MGVSGFAGPVGPQGATGAVRMTGGTGPVGPQGMRGPTGPTGPTGAQGARGATGIAGPPPREIVFPSKEGRSVARFAHVDDVIEIRAKATSTVDWGVRVNPSLTMVLLRDGKEIIVQDWDNSTAYRKDPEDLAAGLSPLFSMYEITPPSQEELVAMFVMAKKALMKMMAVVCAELLISHLSREEMGEAWEDANVLRVMTE